MSAHKAGSPNLPLPPWVSPQFTKLLERDGVDAVVPDFTWYEPLFLKKQGVGSGADSSRSRGRPSCFPPLREVLKLDFPGPPSAAMAAATATVLASSASTSSSPRDAPEPLPPMKKAKRSRTETAGGGGIGDMFADGDPFEDAETLPIFGLVGQCTAVEDLWYGPPLSAKVPPASDYERLLHLGSGGGGGCE